MISNSVKDDMRFEFGENWGCFVLMWTWMQQIRFQKG